MEYSSYKGAGRTFVVRLDNGELFLESIRELCQKEGIDSAIVTSAIGTFTRFRYHWVTTTGFREVEGPLEVLAVQGIIAEGQPHLHAVVSSPDKVYSGHVEDGCRVLYLIEMSIVEIAGAHLTRAPHPVRRTRLLRAKEE